MPASGPPALTSARRRVDVASSGGARRPARRLEARPLRAQRRHPERGRPERRAGDEHGGERPEVAAGAGGESCDGVGDVAGEADLQPERARLALAEHDAGAQRDIAGAKQARDVRKLRVRLRVEAEEPAGDTRGQPRAEPDGETQADECL